MPLSSSSKASTWGLLTIARGVAVQTLWLTVFSPPPPFPLSHGFILPPVLWEVLLFLGSFLEALGDIHQPLEQMEGAIPRECDRVAGSPAANLCGKPTLSAWVSTALHADLRVEG